MLLFWGGLIVLAIFLIRALFPAINPQTGNEKPASPSALDILKRRYATGELTTEQYQEMLSTIQQEQSS
jgi:putative membrane protein